MDIHLIEQIRNTWNPKSGRAGQLIHCWDRCFWHYGVALSNSQVMSWFPEQEGNPSYRGQLIISTLEDNYKNVVNLPYLELEEIFKNLIASVPAFHQNWLYGFQGWNCEHWSRLVVSGQPISYQIKEAFFGLSDAFGTLHYRGEAIEHLAVHRALFS